MKLNDIVLSRAIKAIYMGFVMSRNPNFYLENEYKTSKEKIKEYIDVFNSKTSFAFNQIKIDWDENRWGNSIRVRTIGKTISLTNDDIEDFHSEVEKLINSNLKLATTPSKQIQVFDLNTFDLLDRHTWNTMGDKYLASNRERYMVNFAHLYSIAEY